MSGFFQQLSKPFPEKVSGLPARQLPDEQELPAGHTWLFYPSDATCLGITAYKWHIHFWGFLNQKQVGEGGFSRVYVVSLDSRDRRHSQKTSSN